VEGGVTIRFGPTARVIFDLDGTLVDSVPSLTEAGNALLAEFGRAPLDPGTVTGFVGNGMGKLVERMLRATGGVPESGLDAALERFRAIYGADPLSGTVVYPGVRGCLEALAGAGHGLAVCTQKADAPALAILRGLGLMPPLTGFTGGDSLAVLKPDPAMLRHAAAQLPPGPAMMVGDSEIDAATATAAGVPFLFFSGGYCHVPPETLGARARFDDFAELPALVEALAGEPVRA
jgi:phosphoglycolate phosphatase